MKNRIKNGLLCSMALCMSLSQFTVPIHAESDVRTTKISAHHAKNHEAKKIMDGRMDTSWRSMPQDGEKDDHQKMYDHNRYIDITLDGTYAISGVDVFTEVDGSYNNYYIYASKDGVNYQKVASKTNNDVATDKGDSYVFEAPVEASYLRLNMAYNSNRFETNLAEFKINGNKVSNEVIQPTKIQVSDWQGSQWQQEWDHFEKDQAYANQKVLDQMSALVGRVLGTNWQPYFQFELKDSVQEGKDVFEIKDGGNGTILISGNNGIAMASGFNYYIKNFLNVDYNPLFESNIHVESIVPVETMITKEAQFDLRYALNFCTYSYTMAFWNWDEYEAFIDWAAMNGVNLVLDIVGQEEVIRQTLLEFNYNDEEVKDYLAGPAYYAWFYMQNLYSVGGPLPNSWFEQRVELGRKMHDRMQTYGIQPVIQGFAGQVPHTFAQKNEGAVLTPTDGWVGYTRPSIIKTYLSKEEENQGKRNYFADVAEVFYEKQKNVFGDVSNYYAADPFHEGGNTGGLDVGNIYKTVQAEMLKSNPNAKWVMQQWQNNLDSAKMSQIDTSKAIALDLQADMNPQHDLFEQNGTPWIYCMLHNFGGRMGLDGEVPVIAQDPMFTKQRSKNMTGIGITPEALENSPIVYELFFDTTWNKDPIQVDQWVEKYAQRRAGGNSESLQEAWDILVETAYADKKDYIQGAAESVVNARPWDTFNSASTWGHSKIEYDQKRLDEALVLLAQNYESFKNSPAFKYDLADVSEQVLSNAARLYHQAMVQAKNNKDVATFEQTSKKFLDLIDLSDRILSTNKEFLVGTWIQDARDMITNADDWTKDLFEFNARSLITTWGGERVGSLKDYSNRKWAGLTSTFYKERWRIWVENRLAELKNEKKKPENEKAESNWFLWEFQWANRKSDNGFAFTTAPTDENLGELAQQAYNEFSVTNFDGTIETKENILKGKLFTTSAQAEAGELKNLTDGTTNTEWKAADNNNVVLEVDLEGEYEISQMILSFPQLAKTFPYTYLVEALSENEWKEIKKDESSQLGSNVEIHEKFKATQLRITMRTTDINNEKLRITEIQAFGKPLNVKKLYNVAKGIVPTTNKQTTHPEYPLTNITDENEDNLWKTEDWGDSAYKANITVDLGKDMPTKRVEVVFEKKGMPFKFTVMGTRENGKEFVIDNTYAKHDGILPNKKFIYPVNQDLKAVRVDYHGITGKGDAYAAGPGLSELKIWSDQPLKEIAKEQRIDEVEASGPIENKKVLFDKNYDSFTKVTENQDLVFTLSNPQYVTSATFTFEKGELGLYYQFITENEKGERKTVLEKTTGKDLLGERQIHFEINDTIKKVIFVHKGNNGGGPAHLAEPRLYEVEIFGKLLPTTIEGIQAGDYAALFDGSLDTTKALKENESFEVVLPKPMDILMLSAVKKDGDIKVDVEVEKDGQWVPFGSSHSKEEEAYINGEAVLTSKLKITAKKDVTLKEIRTFIKTYNLEAQDEIDAALSFVNAQKYEGKNGHYTKEAKDEFMVTVNEAKKQLETMINSAECEQIKVNIQQALKKFKDTGRVYITRDPLFAKISYTQSIMNALKSIQQVNLAKELDPAYKEALAVYNEFNATQAQIDEQVNQLDKAIQKALETLEAKDALDVQLAAARDVLKNAQVGDLGGQYSQEAKDALAALIQSVEEQMNAENVDYAPILETLKEGLNTFLASANKIDREALFKTIEDSKAAITLTQHNYDVNAWNAYQEILKQAEALSTAKETEISQKQVDEMIVSLQQATETLVNSVLNYSDLIVIFDEATKKDTSQYTKETVDVLNDAIDKARVILDSNENTQAIIDDAKVALEQAMQGLRIDTSSLQALIDKEVSTKHKQQMFVDAYLDAKAHAQSVVNKSDATYDEMEAAKQALQQAIEALEKAPVVNKEALEQAINQSVDYTNKPDKEKNAYLEALKNAKEVFKDGNASSENVQSALDALLEAIKNVEAAKPVTPPTQPDVGQFTVKVDKTQLKVGETAKLKVLPEGMKVTFNTENKGIITVDATGIVTALKPGTESVTVVGASRSMDPVMITFVVTDKDVVVDKTQLESLIQKAQAIDSKKYTEKSYAALKKALDHAIEVVNDKNATASMIEAAMNDLANALNNLVHVNATNVNSGVATPILPFVSLAFVSLMGIYILLKKKYA